MLYGKYILKISVKNKNDLNKFVERKSPKHDKLLSMTQDSKPKGQAWGAIEDVWNLKKKMTLTPIWSAKDSKDDESFKKLEIDCKNTNTRDDKWLSKNVT